MIFSSSSNCFLGKRLELQFLLFPLLILREHSAYLIWFQLYIHNSFSPFYNNGEERWGSIPQMKKQFFYEQETDLCRPLREDMRMFLWFTCVLYDSLLFQNQSWETFRCPEETAVLIGSGSRFERTCTTGKGTMASPLICKWHDCRISYFRYIRNINLE